MTFDWFLMQAALPEMALAGAILALLLVGAFVKEKNAPVIVCRLAIVSLAGTLALLLQSIHTSQFFAFPTVIEPGNLLSKSMFINDSFAIYAKSILLVMGIIAMFLAKDYMAKLKMLKFEYFILILLTILGGMILVSAHDLLIFYIGLEMMSFSLYILTAYNRNNLRSSEAGLKYFVLGSLASGFMLYGMSLFYGLTGATSFEAIQLALMEPAMSTNQYMMVSIALVMMLVGMLFKLGAVPFHVWTPDVYEGAPTPVTAFMAVVPKIASFAAIIRVLSEPLAPLMMDWQPILMIVAVLTMAIGSIVACVQTNIKRLLAYSSICHVGFMLVALLTGTDYGHSAVMSYLVVYGLTMFGIFAVLLSLRNRNIFLEDLWELRGIAKQTPKLAFTMMLLLFSLTGIPPFAGFLAKFMAFKAAVDAGFVWIAVVAVIFSVVAAYYSLKIIKVMYFEEGGRTLSPDTPKPLGYIAGLSLVMIVALAIFTDHLIGASNEAAAGLYKGYAEEIAQVSLNDTK